MISTLKTAVAWYSRPYEFLDELALKRGFSFHLTLPKMGSCFVTGEPKYLEAIQKNHDLIGGAGTQFLNAIVGNSVITQSSAIHVKKRKALVPFFYHGDHEVIDALTRARMNEAFTSLHQGQVLSMEKWIEDVTVKVIIDFIFGDLEPRFFDDILEIVHGWKNSFKTPLFLFLKPLQKSYSTRWGWGRFIHFRERLREFIRSEMRTPHFRSRSGFLFDFLKKTALSKNSINPWTEDDVVWEMISILVFGHDTSSVAMAWWAYHVLRTNSWEEMSPKNQSGTVSETLIEASLKEAMRLTPPVVHLTRVARAETQILDLQLRENQRVLPCIYLAHRNPAVFANPNLFELRRFVGLKQDVRHSFFPFGFGDRLCLGKNFAERQMLIIATRLLEGVQFKLVKKELKAVRKLVLMAPEEGTPVEVEKIRSGL